MTYRPILFSAPMVRAILAGRKSQTRRLVTRGTSEASLPFALLDLDDPRNFVDGGDGAGPGAFQYLHAWTRDKSPGTETRWRVIPRVVSGMRLWVRETWRLGEDGDVADAHCASRDRVHYRADVDEDEARGQWRPSIFMRRQHSRLTLLVTSVRVERVNTITDEDAIAEGVLTLPDRYPGATPRQVYADLWDELNLKRGYPFAAGDRCWVYEFTREESR